MSKYKRNDPCFCGSGKKYKKCCGGHQAEKRAAQPLNETLLQLHQKLMTAIATQYKSGMEKEALAYAKKTDLDVETSEIYQTGLIPWMIAYSTHLPKQETVMEQFISEQPLSVVMKKHAHIWKNQTPSVYEVSKVDAPQKYFVTIQDILTNESFHIPYSHADDFLEGSLVVGTLIPFENYDNFLYTVIKLYNRDKQDFIALMREYSRKPGGLNSHFPEFFARALTAGMDPFNFEQPTYEEVAQLFVDRMIEKSVADQVISDGILLWSKYCASDQPIIKKTEVYAAALEYYVNKHTMNANLTQSDLAKEYDVSPSTVSKTYIKLFDHVTGSKK